MNTMYCTKGFGQLVFSKLTIHYTALFTDNLVYSWGLSENSRLGTETADQGKGPEGQCFIALNVHCTILCYIYRQPCVLVGPQ